MIKKIIASLLAGMAISIGATIYLVLAGTSKIVGASLFAVGIMMVMEFKFLLFTGYVPTQRETQTCKDYFINSGIVFLGNTVGALITALLLRLTRLTDAILPVCESVCATKLNDNLLSVFILAIFCGIIIAAIVKADNYKKQVLYVVMMIAVFILASFEHVVANAFYLSFTFDIFTLDGILFMLVNMLGNFVGGYAFSYVGKIAVNKQNIE